MKKLTLALAMLVTAAISAQAGSVMKLMFSTKGPDTYADGTTVLKGERYALVWKATADAAVTIAADGTVTGGKMVLCYATQAAGRCTDVLFTADEDYLKDNLGITGGFWSVYLLDTRIWANGKVSGFAALNAAGLPTAINGAQASIAAVAASAYTPTESTATAGVATAETDASNAPTPVVTAIEIVGANVQVTVENAVGYINYSLATGTAPDALTPCAETPAQNGAAGTITLIAPKTENAGFFQVIRK